MTLDECRSGHWSKRAVTITEGQRRAIVRTIQRTALLWGAQLSPECIDDLVQEVLLRLWGAQTLYKVVTCPEYVDKVTRNTVIDTIRRRQAQKRTVRPWARVDLEDLCGRRPRTPEELVIAREDFRLLIKRCRVRMSKRMFKTLVLVHLAGMPRSEVGHHVGLSRAGVDIELHRMRRVLCREVRHFNQCFHQQERRIA